MRITVILMDKEGISDHASGKIDVECIDGSTLLERHKRIYSFYKLENASAFYREVEKQPYIVTEF